jgi:hypothetical protein
LFFALVPERRRVKEALIAALDQPDRLQDASHIELQDPLPAYVEWPRLDSTTATQLAGFECLPSRARRLALGS